MSWDCESGLRAHRPRSGGHPAPVSAGSPGPECALHIAGSKKRHLLQHKAQRFYKLTMSYPETEQPGWNRISRSNVSWPKGCIQILHQMDSLYTIYLNATNSTVHIPSHKTKYTRWVTWDDRRARSLDSSSTRFLKFLSSLCDLSEEPSLLAAWSRRSPI